MKCKDIEGQIIESSGEGMDQEKMSKIEQHLDSCAKCEKLKGDLENLRNVFLQKPPSVPEDLDQRTYQMCKAELERSASQPQTDGRLSQPRSVPLYMKVTLACLLVVMVIWFISLFEDFNLNESLSVPTIVALFFIIQNAVMLIFSPLLLRRFRSKNLDLKVSQ